MKCNWGEMLGYYIEQLIYSTILYYTIRCNNMLYYTILNDSIIEYTELILYYTIVQYSVEGNWNDMAVYIERLLLYIITYYSLVKHNRTYYALLSHTIL